MVRTQLRSWLKSFFPAGKVPRRRIEPRLRAEQLETRLVPSFSVVSTLAPHAIPYAITTGDFNGDGKIDIAVANEFGSDVSVFLSKGGGHFKARKDYEVGVKPLDVIAADVNGDGKLDLITANNLSNNVSVLLGTGLGTFGKAKNFAAGGYPSSIAVADVNGDGKADIVVANGNSPGSVSVLLGNGNGTFAAPVNLATDVGPLGVAVADINGDGKADIVTANIQGGTGAGSLSILLGNGNGTFHSAINNNAGWNRPVNVQIADVNGDGHPDLVVANNASSGFVSVLLGNGNGTFGPNMSFAAGSYTFAVAVADLNGDGKPDLIAPSPADNTVKILLGNGNGTFAAAANAIAGTTPISVAIADFTGDGKPDLAVGNYTSNSVSILKNTYAATTNIVLRSDASSSSGSGPVQLLNNPSEGPAPQVLHRTGPAAVPISGFPDLSTARVWTGPSASDPDAEALGLGLDAFFTQDQHAPIGVYVGESGA
jgi:hypothetical protein